MVIRIGLELPPSWGGMTQQQLRYVFWLLAEGYGWDALKTLCFARWTGMEIIRREAKGWAVRLQGKGVLIPTETVQAALEELNWLEEVPEIPLCLNLGKDCTPLPADFQEVPFERYLICDNLYQGFLITQEETLLKDLAKELYGTKVKDKPLSRTAALYWMMSLKAMLAREFPHFFRPTQGGGLSPRGVIEAMNAQLRALTKGDPTKEKEVLALDTWRAITELDAQAKEWEEMEKKYPKL